MSQKFYIYDIKNIGIVGGLIINNDDTKFYQYKECNVFSSKPIDISKMKKKNIKISIKDKKYFTDTIDKSVIDYDTVYYIRRTKGYITNPYNFIVYVKGNKLSIYTLPKNHYKLIDLEEQMTIGMKYVDNNTKRYNAFKKLLMSRYNECLLETKFMCQIPNIYEKRPTETNQLLFKITNEEYLLLSDKIILFNLYDDEISEFSTESKNDYPNLCAFSDKYVYWFDTNKQFRVNKKYFCNIDNVLNFKENKFKTKEDKYNVINYIYGINGYKNEKIKDEYKEKLQLASIVKYEKKQ
jgi:hypothetical protein